MRTNAENFVNTVQTSGPSRANLCAKYQILTVLGLYSHIYAPIDVTFGKLDVYRDSVSPCGAKNPFLDH